MRNIPYVVCDVFTDRALAGNQLAVFTDAQGFDAPLMQALAREMSFSESTFVLPPMAGGQARIRIFTPSIEVPFAGHPTLGTAFVIAAKTHSREVVLETGAGNVPVRLEYDGLRPIFGWMTQPAPKISRFMGDTELLAALGVEHSELPVDLYDNGIQHLYVALESRAAVASVRPDMNRLAALHRGGVSVFSGEGLQWKTRMFAPAGGVPEDPATGSAAGPLALHLTRYGRVALGQTIQIEQGAELDRPSLLHARVQGNVDAPTVEVGGAAVIVARGEFSLDD